VLYIFGVMKIVTHSPWRHTDSEQEYGSAPTVKGFKSTAVFISQQLGRRSGVL